MTSIEVQDLSQDYRILGLSPGAEPSAIKTRYRDLAKKWHPDRFAGRPAALRIAEARMKALNGAFRRIKDAPLGKRPPRTRVAKREALWTRPCPNCFTQLMVEGNRYTYCRDCGVGFFPKKEGGFHWYDQNSPPLTSAQVTMIRFLWSLWFVVLYVDNHGFEPLGMLVVFLVMMLFFHLILRPYKPRHPGGGR